LTWPLLGAACLTACATSAPVYDPVIPFESASAGVTAFTVPGDSVPEKAVGLDVPTDYSYISSTAMNQAMYAVPGASVGAAAAGGFLAVLIIAAVDAGIDADRNGKINKFLDAQHFDAESIFYSALKSELEKGGYVMAVVDGATAAPGKGAVLDVDITHYGYQIDGVSWIPTVFANVTVKDENGKLLLKDAVALGGPAAQFMPAAVEISPLGGDSVILPYNPRYIFKDVDSIVTGDPAVSVGALKFALESAAVGVARLVGTNPLRAPVAVESPAVAAENKAESAL
jgi:hypothetical protein